MENIKKVVGTMIFQNGKLLIDKPRKRPTYQMIGGGIEDGETPLEAAIRECREELGEKAIFDESKFEFIMDFIEIATSDPNLKIHMHIFKYNGKIEGNFSTSEEIGDFMWFGIEDDRGILSNTLRNEVVPYCIDNHLMY